MSCAAQVAIVYVSHIIIKRKIRRFQLIVVILRLFMEDKGLLFIVGVGQSIVYGQSISIKK